MPSPSQESPNPLPALAAIALLVLSFGRWPYGFYTLMRFVVCGSAAYMALKANRQGKAAWIWTLGAIAVLFNPVLPVRMSRTDWQMFDLGAAAVLGAALVVLRRRPRTG